MVFTTDIAVFDARALAVDATGNAYIAALGDVGGSMTIVKLDAGGGIAYQKTLGIGSPAGIAVDSSGSAYVTGIASSPGLPTTPGAFQPVSKGPDAFVVKLNPAGDRIVYATFIGGSGPVCNGGSHCTGFVGLLYSDDDASAAIAVNAGGNAYVAGRTNSRDFPTTPSAFQQSCPCFDTGAGVQTSAWVAELNPAGSALVYATFLTGGNDGAADLKIDTDGNAYVIGTTASATFPITPGVAFPEPVGDIRLGNVFVSKLDPAGQALVYSTYLGPGDTPHLTLDADRNVFLSGTVAANGQDFLSHLNASGSALLDSTALPLGLGGAGVGVDANGSPVILGSSIEQGFDSSGSILTIREGGQVTYWIAGAESIPAVLGLTNFASNRAATQLAPGEIVNLFGMDLGSDEVAVYMNSIAAPIVFNDDQRIVAIVPYEVGATGTVTVFVSKESQVSNVLAFPLIAAEPRVLTGNGYAALAYNEDGSSNSGGNPAHPGSLLTVYATGAGLIGPDGGPILPVTCRLGGASVPPSPTHECPVLSAGLSPSLIAGIIAIQIRLPDDVPYEFSAFPSLEFEFGDAVSDPVGISVSP